MLLHDGQPRLTAAKRDDDTLSQCETSASTLSPLSAGIISPKEWQDGQTPTASEDSVVIATDAALSAVHALCRAVAQEQVDPDALRQLSAEALASAEAAYTAAREARPRGRSWTGSSRQSFCEFASQLGEEVAEEGMRKVEATLKVVEEYKDEGVRYAERTLIKAWSLIEDHYLIDEAFRLLGPMVQDSNFARDVHDWFNLVALLPVVVINLLNFSCSDPYFCGVLSGAVTLPGLWTGQHWEMFWWTTFFYFVVDLLFVTLLPNCVRSPKVIIYHHTATLLYIMVPKMQPKFAWFMGACMLVEVNTWFLIARRVFNKLGEKSFAAGVSLRTSLRLAVVSVSFYVSWFAIRIFLYPYLFVAIVQEWYQYWGETGTPLNLVLICPFIQSVLICMNFKWTVDLIRSKLKGRSTAGKANKGL